MGCNSLSQPGAGYSQYLLDECVIVVHFHGLVKVGATTKPENLEERHVRV